MPKELTPYQLAEQKIADALRSGATELDLSNPQYKDPKPPQLTELPDSLWQLTQLTSLNLSSNQLTTLPDWLGQLTQLTELDLSNNQLTALPDSLGQLTQLTSLDLSSNQLTSLPDSLGQLTQLQTLYIKFNLDLKRLPKSLGNLTKLQSLEITVNKDLSIPDSIGNLTQLQSLKIFGYDLERLPEWIRLLTQLDTLIIASHGLTEIPKWVVQLKLLKRLWFPNNKLIDIHPSLIQLEHLTQLNLDGNPLNPALQSAYDACNKGGGTYESYDPLWAYLRSLETNAKPLYEAKLVLVGEGNVGKTTLLKALKGKVEEPPQKNEATTHGVEIDIHALRLPHPQKDGVEIQLNAWDFGGQDVYRVTHQFFFSRRSLYLLVWEPRRGVQQGQVEDWLNMIRLRVGDDARVLIISTHCKTGERIARIDKDVLQRQYGEMIVDFLEVDSLVPDQATGEMVGIAELKKVIARESAQLEQMGMMFNNDWKAARDELLARDEPRISFGTFSGICAARGLSQLDAETLAHLMHDLGYIVHYSDDEKLRDDVVLKPQWLTKAIGFVLEDRATAEREGILPDGHLTQVWRDHAFEGEPRYDPEIYPFFLRLMEKYDVCYRLTDGKASLVAQHVPQVRPELPWLPEQEPPKDQRRIAMVCSMEEDPPGLVPWMIVRTHDYAYPVNAHSLHWQKGMFLSHGTHGTAMLEKRDREFHIYTQAIYPEYFMNVLQETLLKLIKDNWPGLEGRYRFSVPCPEVIKGEPCKGRFNIHTLREILADGDTTIRCQECVKKQSITELLLGFEKRSPEELLQEMRQEMNARFDGIESLAAYYFMSTLRAIADEAKHGPRLFTIHPRAANFSLKQIFTQPLELQLWCEAEGCQHPVYDKGLYFIDSQKEWVKQIAPYANFVLGILKTVSPIAAPAINVAFGAKTTEAWGIKDHLDLTKAFLDKLPGVKSEQRGISQRDVLTEPERSGILALHSFLRKEDPHHEKIGLHLVPTYTGDYRWLCKRHYDAYQPNIPDVINGN